MFQFADLFAGVGGFHAALGALGGRAVFASEIDPAAVAVYERNWQMDVAGDIVRLTQGRMEVPSHDVLAAGFPCQPFSKSGFQRGMAETRGTLFWNICRVLEERRPAVILLENVRNLAGPRHKDTWATIIRSLRDLGYKTSGRPTVFSPHLLPPDLGGSPQTRDRVFIAGTYVGRERAWAEATDDPLVPHAAVDGWDPWSWDLESALPLESEDEVSDLYRLSDTEAEWIAIWDDFVRTIRADSGDMRLPGFPIWADAFQSTPHVPPGTAAWKADFLRKNSDFYVAHREALDAWLQRHDQLRDLPASRRKLEWQAQDADSLLETILHFRPSGIRAKKATYTPALVAITQTTVLAARGRRMTPRETARLQGLPDWFDFGAQSDAATYKQMGNGVNVGAAYYILRTHVLKNLEDVSMVAPHVAESVLASPPTPVVSRPSVDARAAGVARSA